MNMKTKLHRLLACLLCAVLLLGLAPLSGFVGLEWPDFSALFATKAQAAAPTSGTCGENLTWNYDESTKTLTISGTGKMENYSLTIPTAPWKQFNSEMKVVVIEIGVTSIGAYAFFNCTGLTSVMIPASVTSIGESAFYNCTGLKTAGPIGGGYDYEFGWTTTIPSHAFYGCSGLTSVTIGNSVTSIGDYAFCYCTGLTSVTIPDSVTSIGYDAFYGCTGLTSVTIPDSVTSIGGYAFNRCRGLTSITVKSDNPVYHSEGNCLIGTKSKILIVGCKTSVIPTDGSVTSIGPYAFSDCTGLTSVTIPDSVTRIGGYAFRDCTGLTSVTIPDSVTSIGVFTFLNCTGLTSVTIPDSVKSIDSSAFKGCTGLTSVTIPDSVKSIGESAFYGCTALTSVTIGNGVTSIGDDAFVLTKLHDVYYQGTKVEWEKIIICDGNLHLLYAHIHYLNEIYTATFLVDFEVFQTETFTATQESIHEPEVPEKPGYTGSWAPYILSEQDLTIKAIYKPITYYATFVADGAQVGEPIPFTVETGSITPPAVPEKTGYSGVWQPFTLGPGDLTVEAIYSQVTYYATFLAEGAEIAKIPFVYGQESIHEPAVPEKPGYTGSWSPYILSEQDITIEAIYKPITYYATFVADGAQVGEPIPFTVLTESITPPAVPEKTGYSGVWQPFTLGTADLTVEAVYSQITYYATILADGATIAKIPFVYGQKSITLPDVPKKEGHTGAWPTYTLPAHDITIEAVYTPIEYTITYLVDEQSIGSGTIPYGGPIWQPRIPQKEGYTFTGWTPAVPDTMPAEDLTFRAVFKANPYTVTWIVDGAEFKTETVLFGQPVSAPTPEKAGYTFSGWDAEVPAAMPAKDLTFRGSFTLNQYTLRLISDGVELVNTRVAHGTPFQLLTAPTKAGYTLLGWADDPAAATAAYAVGGTYTFNADTTLYAVWQKNDTPPAAQPTVTIKNYTATKSVDYKATVTFTAVTENAPAGATIQWLVSDKKAETGATCTVKQATADYTVQVKLIGADGAVLAESEVETVRVNTGFFAKLIAFFKGLFGSLPVIAQRAF